MGNAMDRHPLHDTEPLHQKSCVKNSVSGVMYCQCPLDPAEVIFGQKKVLLGKIVPQGPGDCSVPSQSPPRCGRRRNS